MNETIRLQIIKETSTYDKVTFDNKPKSNPNIHLNEHLFWAQNYIATQLFDFASDKNKFEKDSDLIISAFECWKTGIKALENAKGLNKN